MSSLLDQTEKVLERIKKAESARGNVEAAHALNELNKQLSERAVRISTLVDRFRLLKAKGVTIARPVEVDPVEERLKSVSLLFKDNPVVSTLKAGQRWTGLLSSLDSLQGTISQFLQDIWKNYFKNALFAGLPPDVLRNRLAPTPENKKRLGEYAQLYAKFVLYRDRAPESSDQFEELQAVSRKLGSITFEEEVPKDVAAFLRATSSEAGGELTLLTTTVLDWLREHDLVDKYAIRARVG